MDEATYQLEQHRLVASLRGALCEGINAQTLRAVSEGVPDEATKTLAYLATIGSDSRMAKKQARLEFEQIAHDGEQDSRSTPTGSPMSTRG